MRPQNIPGTMPGQPDAFAIAPQDSPSLSLAGLRDPNQGATAHVIKLQELAKVL